MKIHLLTLISIMALTASNVNARPVSPVVDDNDNNSSARSASSMGDNGRSSAYAQISVDDVDAVNAAINTGNEADDIDIDSKAGIGGPMEAADENKNAPVKYAEMVMSVAFSNASILQKVRQNEKKKREIAKEMLSRLGPVDLSNQSKRDELIQMLLAMGCFPAPTD